MGQVYEHILSSLTFKGSEGTATVVVKGDVFTITGKLGKGHPSSTGKSQLVVSGSFSASGSAGGSLNLWVRP